MGGRRLVVVGVVEGREGFGSGPWGGGGGGGGGGASRRKRVVVNE